MTDFDDATWAFLENEKLEQTRDYLRRGRPYAGLAPADLQARWVAAFRDFAADIGDDDDLVLRRLDPRLRFLLEGVENPKGIANLHGVNGAEGVTAILQRDLEDA